MMKTRRNKPIQLLLRIVAAAIFPMVFLIPLPGNAQEQKVAADSSLSGLPVATQIKILNQWSEAYRNNNPAKAEQFVRKAIGLSKQTANDTALALSFKNLGNINYVTGQLDSALILYHRAYEIYRQLNDSAGWSTCLNNMAIVHTGFGEFDKAINELLRATDIKLKLNDLYMASIFMRSTGDCYYYKGDYKNAMGYYVKASKLTRYFDDPQFSVQLQISIGSIFEALNDFGKALDYYQNALVIADSINDLYFKSIILYDIGLVYFSMEKYPEAFDLLNRSLAIKEDINFTQGIPNALILLGKIYETDGKPEKANELYIRSMKISYKLKDKHLLVKSLNSIAGNLLTMQHYDDALDYLSQSLEIATEIGAKPEISDIYREMALTFAALRQMDSADFYLDHYLKLEDSLKPDESAVNAFADSLQKAPASTFKKNTAEEIGNNEPPSPTPKPDKLPLEFLMAPAILIILLTGICIIIFVTFATGLFYGNRKNNKRLFHK